MTNAAFIANGNSMDDRPRVLSIDDNAANQKLVERVLCSHYQVRTAASGAEGLEAMFSYKPDIVLLDVAMGNLSGVHLCRMIRSEPDFFKIPVLFITARTGEDDRRECFQAGGDDFIPKPIEVNTLAERIELNLQRAKKRSAQDTASAKPGVDETSQYLNQCMLALIRHRSGDEVCSTMLSTLGKLGLKGAIHRHSDGRVFSSIGLLTDLEGVLLEQARQPYPPDFSGRFLWGSANFGAIIHNMPSVRDSLHARTHELLNTLFNAADSKLELLEQRPEAVASSLGEHALSFNKPFTPQFQHNEHNLSVHGFKLECALEELERINESNLGQLAKDLKALAERLARSDDELNEVHRLSQRCADTRTAIYAQCLEAQTQYSWIMADLGQTEHS